MKARIFTTFLLIFSVIACNIETNTPIRLEVGQSNVNVDIVSYEINMLDTKIMADIPDEIVEDIYFCEVDLDTIYTVSFSIGPMPYYAEIWLDDELAGVVPSGETPLTIDLAQGPYDLVIRQEICYPLEDTICVDEQGKEFLYFLEEIPYVDVYFHSDPTEVEITLHKHCEEDDGHLTPYHRELWAGAYTLHACKEGYHTYIENIEISADTTEIFVKLDPVEQ